MDAFIAVDETGSDYEVAGSVGDGADGGCGCCCGSGCGGGGSGCGAGSFVVCVGGGAGGGCAGSFTCNGSFVCVGPFDRPHAGATINNAPLTANLNTLPALLVGPFFIWLERTTRSVRA